ncbi:unnamed protein product [marine sediment metagenome]|uniref:Uncharacterized protein n=1 Tax=marine sediment metagenome TaxID=412755 RepID=X1G8A2_9ZZZZ
MPEELEIKLPRGTIHRVEICFPDGCFALAKAQVWHEERQIWPSNLKAWFAWNNYCIVFNEDYILPEDFNIMRLKGHNNDDSYSHIIIFRFGVKGDWRLHFEGLGEEVII